ncbi:hypothetical protein KAI87_04910, partial [Myxococcota bacterium]|nr:hypothetical protein [Myxococcota bacterium]
MSLSRSFRNPGVLSHFNTKLSLVLLLPLALVVTSCDSDDDEESSSDDPVSFECTDDIYCSDFAPCAQKCNNGFCEESFDNSRCLSDNPCEIGVCSPDVADADANGCSFTQKDCADDDNSCTVNHHCDAESGGCVYDLGVGCCDFDADCEDGVACTVDICTDHLCTPQYDHGYCLSRDTNKCDGLGAECTDEGCAGVEAAIDCDDDDPCTSELCIDATGVCEYSVASVSGACCNSDVCNGANECCTPDSNSTLPLGCYPKEYCDGYVCVEELSSEVCLRGADLSAQNIMLSKDSSARGEALLATWEIYNNNADDVTDPVHYQYLLSEDELPDAGDIRLYALEERITSGTIAARGQLSIQQKVYLQEDTGSGLVPLHESVFGDYNILFEVNPSHEAG